MGENTIIYFFIHIFALLLQNESGEDFRKIKAFVFLVNKVMYIP